MLTRLRPLWALLAGALMPLGFAPLHWLPLIPLALALLFWLWRGCSAAAAFWLGWLFGVGMFGAGVSWIYISIHDMGHLPVVVAGLLTMAFVSVLALFPALLGGLSARWLPRMGWFSAMLWLPAGWVLSEWLRSTVFTGFPWLLIGHSQVDGPLAPLLPLFGTLALSWLLALAAVALLGVFGGLATGGRGRAAALVLLLLLLIGGPALLPGTDWTEPAGRPLSFSLLQEGTPQQIRWQREQRVLSINRYLDLMQDEWGRDLIVWPENAMALFHHQIGSLRASLGRQAREQQSALLIGMPYLDPTDRRYYNSAVLFPERVDGANTVGRYDKRQLVPFTEYMPWQGALQWLLDSLQVPMSAFSAGAKQQPALDVGGVPVAVSICFESAYPDAMFAALPQAQLLINLSNDGWFGDSLGPHQHLQIARVRAAEAGRWMLRATNTGITALIDAQGRVVKRVPAFEPAVLRGEIQPMRGTTPYVEWGNRPVLLLMLLLLLAGLLVRKTGKG